ncbi:hypothetical protein [Thalassotalea maritima]|uniref:hypothetical protein n=1 Tax=Thalassotalea maritima TaxID=3242416 RepID=UPI0035271293
MTKTWSTKSELTYGRYGAATAVVDNKMYVFAGNYSADTAEVYDPTTDTWQEITGNSKLSDRFDTAVVNGRFIDVVISQITENSLVLRYNTLNDSWQVFTINTESTAYKDTVIYKGRTYLIGGTNDTENTQNVVSYYIGDN